MLLAAALALCRGPPRTGHHGHQKAFKPPKMLVRTMVPQQPVAVVLDPRPQQHLEQSDLVTGTQHRLQVATLLAKHPQQAL